MRRLFPTSALLIGLTMLGPANSAAAQSSPEASPVSQEEEARLRGWFDLAAAREDSTRALLASGYIVAGTLASAVGVTSLAELTESPLLTPFVSTYMLTSGLFFIGSGIATLLTMDRSLGVLPGDARLTVSDVRRLDERLAAAADQAEDARIVTAVLGGVITVGGITSLSVLGATGVDPTDAPLDYGLSTVFAVAGAVSMILSFLESPAEVDFRTFREGGQASAPAGVSFHATGTGFLLVF